MSEEEIIIDKCTFYRIKNYIINDDMTIDIDGSVDLSRRFLKKIPLNFNKVTGDFDCSCNNLVTLEGCPKYVGRSMWCYNNELVSLDHCPKYIGRDFNYSNNSLGQTDVYPDYIGGRLSCFYQYSEKSCKRISSNIFTVVHDLVHSSNLWKF